MKLYMTDVSGNSFKVRVLASILNVPYEKVYVDWPTREHKSPAFLELNRRGQVPVMEIEGRVLWDSTAHLVYIARKFGGEDWLPSDPLDMAEVMQWLSFAQNEVNFGLQRARGVLVYGGRQEVYERAREDSLKALDVLTWHLGKGHDWLALGRPTLADIAVYPYVMRAPEAAIDLGPYPEVRAWIARCEALPGWLTLES
jgi:glutathione S-transferase